MNPEITAALASLSTKERKALREALIVLYLNDRSDYINGLWSVVDAIVGDFIDEETFDAKKILTIIDPELNS